MYDAIVVGARCAGSPTAMLLARKGYRVLLVDKATFPSDTISTHHIHQPGYARLKRWGLLDRVAHSNCPPTRQVTFDLGPFALIGSPPPADGVAESYAPRRTVLDKILVDAAAAAGVELREGFSVQEITTDGERVTGIRGSHREGVTVTERARIVIGADGLHSVVARQVQAPVSVDRASQTFNYYSYWSGVTLPGVELYPRERRFMVADRTNDGRTIIVVVGPAVEFHEFRADVEGNFWKTLQLAPDLAERVRQGRREERILGTVVLPTYLRKPFGPGWALVGDAGYHKDPITAQGISDAFRDAELLTEAIDAGFAGRRALEEALGDYERRRDEEVLPMCEYTSQLARLAPPPPETQLLFAALRGNQAQIDRFLGVTAGTVPVWEFYSPENTGQILAEAGVAAGRTHSRPVLAAA